MNNLKLDYSIEKAEDRVAYVKKLLKNYPEDFLSNKYLEILSNYIVFAADKEEKKKKKIITDNRAVTITKREVSYQALAEKFQQGEDGLYTIIANDKNIIFKPRVCITEKDYQEIPELQTLRDSIKVIEELEKKATGQKKFILKKQLIEMHREAYMIKDLFRKTIYFVNVTKSFNDFKYDEEITITPDYQVKSNGLISLFNKDHISAILCNYSQLKENGWGNFESDTFFLMEDFDNIATIALKPYPLYEDLVLYKIDGKTNLEIQQLLNQKHNKNHAVEYISSLWRNKIPKIIADKAQELYLLWYYTYKEKGHWKICNRCGQKKLAIPRFFSKNSASKDGFYSLCKECRSKKRRG